MRGSLEWVVVYGRIRLSIKIAEVLKISVRRVKVRLLTGGEGHVESGVLGVSHAGRAEEQLGTRLTARHLE